MFKVYKLLSSNSQYPLAEIRTDGNVIDVTVDNTDGKITEKIKNFQQLTKLVRNSSVLSLKEDKEPTANLLRYVMDNGDIVEITTDGHTAILNSKLLSLEEKDALFAAIKRGDIKVSRKADLTQPVPVFPSSPKIEQAVEKPEPSVSEGMMKVIQENQFKLSKLRSMSTKSYDYEIENGDYSGAEDPEYCKKMLYALRYGDSNE